MSAFEGSAMQAALEQKTNGTSGPVITEKSEPKKLSKEEILEFENSFLKIQNLKLQGDKLQQDMVRCNDLIQKEQQKLRDLRESVSKKYGIDLAKNTIAPDGTLVPLQGQQG